MWLITLVCIPRPQARDLRARQSERRTHMAYGIVHYFPCVMSVEV